MRPPLAPAAFVVFALAWGFAAAHAQDATPKPPDVMTVNGVLQPAPAHGTTPDLTLPPSAAPAYGTRQRTIRPAAPAGPVKLEPAQLAKRAAAPAARAAGAFAADEPKPADLTTALPPTGPPPAPDKEAPPVADPRSVVGVFGRIPRPEWGSGLPLKPEQIVTIGPPTGIDAPSPSPAKAPANVARKPNETSTSLPRDPAAPPPSAAKPAPPREEVRP